MLCCRCSHNHLTILEELNCASGKRTKIGSSQSKGRVEIVDPGANRSEVSKPQRVENGKTTKTDSLSIFEKKPCLVTKGVTKGRPRRYETNAARQQAYRERRTNKP